MRSHIGPFRLPGPRPIARGTAPGSRAPATARPPISPAVEHLVFVRAVEDRANLKPFPNLKYRLLDPQGNAVAEGQTDFAGTLRKPVTAPGAYGLELGAPGPDGKPAGGTHPVRANPVGRGASEPEVVVVPPSTAPPLVEVRSVRFDLAGSDAPQVEVRQVIFDLAPSDVPQVEIRQVIFDLTPQQPPPVVEVRAVIFALAT